MLKAMARVKTCFYIAIIVLFIVVIKLAVTTPLTVGCILFPRSPGSCNIKKLFDFLGDMGDPVV